MLPERLKRRVIYESDWIDLYADTVRMPDGSIIEPYHVLHYPHNSVSVVIYNNKDEILMLRSKRYTAGGLEWEIPAGRVEKMNPLRTQREGNAWKRRAVSLKIYRIWDIRTLRMV